MAVSFERTGAAVAVPLLVQATLWRHRPLLEAELEAALLRRLERSPKACRWVIHRQLKCCGRIPDLTLVDHDLRVVAVVEIKREVIGARAIEQVEGYVAHFGWHVQARAEDWRVFGVVAAPNIRPSVLEALPWWCVFQPLDVRPAPARRAA
jgi:hypothetical protein